MTVSMKVISQPDYSNYEIQDKRFPLPECIVSSACPGCSKEIVRDYKTDYVSYPKSGAIHTQYFFCDPCDVEWEIDFRFIIEARVEPVLEKTDD